MSEFRFDPSDIKILRERVARPSQSQSGTLVCDAGKEKSERGFVQLNVRVRAELKQRLHAFAQQRRTSLADVIEHAVEALERQSR